jgi:hypothetical protein
MKLFYISSRRFLVVVVLIFGVAALNAIPRPGGNWVVLGTAHVDGDPSRL